MLPVNALNVHLQMADIPIIDTAALAILGNDDLLLRLMCDKASQDQINDYVPWTLHTARAFGLKVINAGGANAFKCNASQFDLDDVEPESQHHHGCRPGLVWSDRYHFRPCHRPIWPPR